MRWRKVLLKGSGIVLILGLVFLSGMMFDGFLRAKNLPGVGRYHVPQRPPGELLHTLLFSFIEEFKAVPLLRDRKSSETIGVSVRKLSSAEFSFLTEAMLKLGVIYGGHMNTSTEVVGMPSLSERSSVVEIAYVLRNHSYDDSGSFFATDGSADVQMRATYDQTSGRIGIESEILP